MGVDMAVQTAREFGEHFCIMRGGMAVGALRNLPVLCMAFGAGNGGMFAGGGCPGAVHLLMTAAACGFGAGLVSDLQRPMDGVA